MSRVSKEVRERFKQLDKAVESLDRHCSSLLAFFTVMYPDEFGFNELHRKLRNLNKYSSQASLFKSKTTLSTHMKHLLNKQYIVVRVDKKSKLKIKPRKYTLSPYLVEISKDVINLKALSLNQALEPMRGEDIRPLTIMLIDILLRNVCEFLESVITYPEKLAALYRSVTYWHFDNIMNAYRIRVLEKGEEKAALGAISEFNNAFNEFKREKWLHLIKSLSFYEKWSSK